MWSKLENFLLFIVFLVWPWQTRYFLWQNQSEYLSISLYVSDLVILSLLLVKIFNTRNFCSQLISALLRYRYIVAGLLLLLLSSLAMANNKGLVLYVFFKLLIAGGLAWLIAASDLSLSRLKRYFFVGLLPVALLTILQFSLQTTWANKWLGLAAHESSVLGQVVVETGAGERWLRAYGSFDHPNILGGVMALALLLLTFKKEDWGLDKNFYIILFATSLFFSFSRTAWLGLGGALLIYVLALGYEKFRSNIKPVVITIVTAVALASIYWPIVVGRTNISDRLEQKSVQERLSYYGQAKEVFLAHPWGVGLGNYIPALMNQRPGQPVWSYQPVHNAILLSFVELGLVGLALISVMIWMIRLEIVKLRLKKDSEVFALLSLVLILSLFDHWLYSLHIGLLLIGLVVGLGVKLTKDYK